MTTKSFINHRVLWLFVPLLMLFNLSAWGANQTYTLVSDVSTLTSSDKILIVAYNGSSYYALKNNQKSSADNLPATSVTISSNTITADLETDYTWNAEYKDSATISGTSYRRYYFKSTKGNWYLQNAGAVKSKITTKSGTDAQNIWVVGYTGVNGVNSCTGLWNQSASRMLSVYNSDFRAYASANFSSINGHTVYIYKKGTACDKNVTLTYDGDADTHGCTFVLKAGSSSGSTIAEGGTTANCGSGTTVVAVVTTPASHYHVASVNATNKTGDISDQGSGVYHISYSQGSNISSTVTVTFEADPTYTVTWVAGSNPSFSTQTNYAGTALSDPGTPSSALYCPGGKEFVGWTATPIVGEVDEAPNDLFTSVSGKSIPEGGTTYYAVFATQSGGGASFDHYEKVTSAPDDWTEDTYVLATGNSGYVLTGQDGENNYGGYASMSTTTERTAYEITVTEVSSGVYKLQQNSKYLTLTSNNNYLGFASSYTGADASNNKCDWKIYYYSSGGGYVIESTKTYTISKTSGCYRAIQFNSDRFACYKYMTQTPAYLYKRVETSGYTYSNYATSCGSCSVNPTIGAASLNGSFSLTEVGVSCASSGAGTNCAITEYGWVWSDGATNTDPLINGSGVTNSPKTSGSPAGVGGAFTGTLSGSFTAGHTYYYKAYVTNGKPATTYSSVQTFTPYTVNYNKNEGSAGGSAPSQQVVNTGGTVTLAPATGNFTWTGHYISKWAIGSAGGTQYTPGETSPTISANTTFYAVWATNTYTVTFDKNGGGEGTGTADQNFTYGTAQDLNGCGFTAPDGKYFLGWNTDKNATTATYTNGQEVNNLSNENGATVTLYAIWKDHTYTNYRTLCGCSDWGFYYGTDGQSDWTFECFSQVDDTHEWRTGVFSIPNKPNWYVDNAAGNDARKVLTTWSTLYFAASQGDGVRPMVGAAVGATGKVRIYDDNGWNNRYAGFIPDGYKLKFGTDYSPFTLSDGNTYYSDVVTYNSSTANRTVAVGVINANSSNAYVSTDNTQEMRHIFLNTGGEDLWSKNNTPYFGLYDITNTRFTCLMVAVPGQDYLYEGWVPSNCTQVMFVRLKSSTLEFGSIDSNVHNKTGNLSLQSDKSLFTITDWGAGTWSAYERSGKFRIDVNYTDKNWYARFYPQYVLHYDANGGSGAPADQSIATDASPCQLTVSTTEPTQAGYTFLGWNPTKASADAGTKDDDWDGGDTHAMTGDVTLYAVWAANHTLSYNYNGGDGSSCVGGSYYTGQSFTACSSAGDKTGYTFTGWLGSNSTNYTAGTTYSMPNSDLTLTAQWSATDYVVTMAQSPAAGATLNGGTTTAHYGGTINISTNVPSGYVFNGWTSSPSVTFADASATSTSFTMPASNVTITANFTPTHTATFVGADGSTLQTVTVAEGAAVTYSESTPVSCDEEANPSSTFVGWATDTWTGKKAAKGNIPVGTTFYDIVGGGESLPNMGNGDVTYYAVFAKATGDPLTNHVWEYTFTTNKYGSSGTVLNSGVTKTLDGTESAVTVNKDWTLQAYGPLDKETWEYANVATDTKDNTKGIKIGTGSAPAQYMYFNSSAFTGTVTAVKISTSGGSMTQTTVGLTVDGTNFLNSGNATVYITSSNTEYSFTGSKTISGDEIAISWYQATTTTALYIKKIEVDYTTGGDISYSNYMTTCSTCTTPSGVTASNITEASADITWSGVSSSGTTGFTIQWGTDGTRTNNENTANTDANTKTKSLTGLEAGTTYYVWVSSRCDGTWSDRASFTTLAVHDITFNKDNGTLSVVSPVGVVDGETLTFPNVTSTSCGTFVGWKVTEVSDYDNVSAPSPLYKHNDTKENIIADESYQAVYRTATGAETDVTDNVTIGVTGVTGNYADFTGATASSSAVYTGNVKKDDTRIQMRNSSNSGIVTTTSGGLAKKVTFNWAGSNTSGRIVDVYGKNTAYSSAADLYSADVAVQGTKIGSITYGTSTELTISTDYNYIGIRAKDGAAYASSIDIIWYGTPMSYMTAPACDEIVGITASFSAFTYVYGSGPSAAQSFMVSGINLSEALVVTAPTNYEVCKTADGTYTSSVSFTPAAGKVSAETVYIRLAAGLNVGTYNYDAANGVSVASNSATPQTAALNGSVTKAAGAIAFTDFNAVDHYEAELEKGMSDIDVTLTVSVTGDGSVSYSKSPAAGVSPTIPATQPTTTLHVLQPGIWTVTATLTAGTNYTGANTNCEVRVKRVDTYVDFIHNKTIKEYSSGATVVDGKMSDWGSGYTVPKIDDNAEETSGSCQQTHFKFIGWVSEDDINIVDGTFKPGYTIVTAGTEEKRSTSKTYYAIWAKLEE